MIECLTAWSNILGFFIVTAETLGLHGTFAYLTGTPSRASLICSTEVWDRFSVVTPELSPGGALSLLAPEHTLCLSCEAFPPMV